MLFFLLTFVHAFLVVMLMTAFLFQVPSELNSNVTWFVLIALRLKRSPVLMLMQGRGRERCHAICVGFHARLVSAHLVVTCDC